MSPVLRSVFCACALAAAAGFAQAETPADRVHGRIMAELVTPGFAALATAAARHAHDWTAFCAAPGNAGFADLKDSFAVVADAWAVVEFARSGPAAEAFRADRFNFWPERNNAVERALLALLTAASDADITPAEIGSASAAVQGLPALERFLFDAGASDQDFAPGGPGDFRCKAASAIAANALAIALELAAEPPGGRQDPTEAARAMLATDIVTAFATLQDRKIRPVLGKSRADSRPRQAEAWRSGRSLRNIELNLATLLAIAAIAADEASGNPGLARSIATARQAATALKGDLGAFVTGGERGAVILLLDAVFAAGQLAKTEIPAALGVTIGFSSADGD